MSAAAQERELLQLVHQNWRHMSRWQKALNRAARVVETYPCDPEVASDLEDLARFLEALKR